MEDVKEGNNQLIGEPGVLQMRQVLTTLGYISPNGSNMANPVLVTRQMDSLRQVMRRMKVAQEENNNMMLVSKKLRSMVKNIR